ncbi:heavy metal translocating P-type ATPase [Thermogemmatispora sp.]|uniref:heavy metal translocating P-type ATPase n=1 Tax=Thermogemmatispora sp. TaxID=1968838 RepID=UPI001D925A7A|nr:cation-translocating P-type ATPase [Thermogemmatispora sp.]MBX5449251.1 cation-translocating P-type ATPase [Thermogemmatispora sp.]
MEPAGTRQLELMVTGMDCPECAGHVRQALEALPGVHEVTVLLSAEKALLTVDPTRVDLPALCQAVERAGYQARPPLLQQKTATNLAEQSQRRLTRTLFTLYGLLFGAVLLLIIVGEWLGLLDRLTDRLPWPIGVGLTLLAGAPIFWDVLQAARRGRIISHTLMSLGVLAALFIGQWPTAAVVVFFMHVGKYSERLTSERSRQALKRLAALAPQQARVIREEEERVIPVEEVAPGDIVVVRPGEAIPVDGEVLTGRATIDQAAITGEALPLEAAPGSQVFAASLVQAGSLRIRATRTGRDSTFARIVELVEGAEAQRAPIQRLADRFSAWFLPVVLAVALLALLLRRDPLAAAAVLVVACSCSLALATPIAMLASIAAAASHGLLIKGGAYLELLARADVLLIDKTGTVTTGKPTICEIVPLAGMTRQQVLQLAASAERYSEHPLAEALRQAARSEGLILSDPATFEVLPGLGVRATINGQSVTIGNADLLPPEQQPPPVARELAAAGRTLLFVICQEQLIGLLAASDKPRPEVSEALTQLQALGIKRIELLTGDHEQAAANLAEPLGIGYRARLLPEDKLQIVRAYQAQGHTVIMVGDGLNDAPALAQADIGIALGVIGTDVALEAAHVALLREDWRLLPALVQIARRTMRVVRLNLAFTLLYNLLGLSLAAWGLLPPIIAAAAQSLPDLGILANSTRLLHQRIKPGSESRPDDAPALDHIETGGQIR